MGDKQCSECKHWTAHRDRGSCGPSFSATDADALCGLFEQRSAPPDELCAPAEVVEAVAVLQRDYHQEFIADVQNVANKCAEDGEDEGYEWFQAAAELLMLAVEGKLSKHSESCASDEDVGGYLPCDCPQCGRRRMLATYANAGFVRSVRCEKCGCDGDAEPALCATAEVVEAVRAWQRHYGAHVAAGYGDLSLGEKAARASDRMVKALLTATILPIAEVQRRERERCARHLQECRQRLEANSSGDDLDAGYCGGLALAEGRLRALGDES